MWEMSKDLLKVLHNLKHKGVQSAGLCMGRTRQTLYVSFSWCSNTIHAWEKPYTCAEKDQGVSVPHVYISIGESILRRKPSKAISMTILYLSSHLKYPRDFTLQRHSPSPNTVPKSWMVIRVFINTKESTQVRTAAGEDVLVSCRHPHHTHHTAQHFLRDSQLGISLRLACRTFSWLLNYLH